MRAVCLAMAVLVTIAGCSAPTSGHGVYDPPSAPSTVAPSATAAPSAGAATHVALTCGRGAISSKGAPFCYRLPPRFEDNSTLPSYGGMWSYKTLVSSGQYDLVEVLASRLSFDSDGYSDARLRAFVEPRRFHTGQYGLTRVSGLTAVRVAHARAFQQTATNPAGAKLRSIYVFRGTTEAYVQCERRDQPRIAAAGCASVLASIQVISLG